ncbi:uncharacterized protein LOC111244665 [Varroa destructor]|uniref:Uncharacterized protein n=1 Tax=Varroa destructor TaxID=109461 RepID=A0A7M7J6Z7_VARDE|nr:uncharacterized protein LOC111244665 [Varroa destructor]
MKSFILAVFSSAAIVSAGHLSYSGSSSGSLAFGTNAASALSVSSAPVIANGGLDVQVTPTIRQVGVAKVARVKYVKQPFINVNYVQQPVTSYVTRPVESVSYASRPVVFYSVHPILVAGRAPITASAIATSAIAAPAITVAPIGVNGWKKA